MGANTLECESSRERKFPGQFANWPGSEKAVNPHFRHDVNRLELLEGMPSNLRPDHPRCVVFGAIWRVPMEIADRSRSLREPAFATFLLP